jgi:hypothetical protein
MKFQLGDKIRGNRRAHVATAEVIRVDASASCYDLRYIESEHIATFIDAGWIDEHYEFHFNGVELFMETL